MSTLLIEGGHRLQGRVAVEGNKNAALPLLAACLLTEDECVLTNVPRIGDVEVMARLLLDIGAEVDGIGSTTLRIRAPQLRTHPIAGSSAGCAGRCYCLDRCSPGWGARISRLQEAIFRRAGRSPRTSRRSRRWAHGRVKAPTTCSRLGWTERRFDVLLCEASVTGTETALLAAATAPGPSEIRHAALEPHVVELCEFLQKMGVGITGIGTPTIAVEGVSRPHGAEHRLGGDYIEAGSWAVVAAITGGEIHIEGAREAEVEVVAAVLKRMNVRCGMRDGVFEVKPSQPKAARRITTGLWPSFPSDLISLVTVLATQAQDHALVHDWMYELRLFALEQLSGMGADLFLADAHRIIVSGPTRLRGGRVLDSRDIRSGMSLIAAGLAADGQTRVQPLEIVERGYSQLVERLQGLARR